jgi:hypothetical protein
VAYPTPFHMDWLRFTRILTLYVAPSLAAIAVVVEIIGWRFGVRASPFITHTYYYLLLIVFALLTAILIGICGWIVWLWDLDRLFFKLESKIDSQIAILESKSDENGSGGSLLGRAKELLLSKVLNGGKAKAVRAIVRSYWTEINAGGALLFPKPNITAAVDQIEKSHRDLIAPLNEIVSQSIPLGGISAPIVSRFIFMYFAPDVKVRLYRRLLARFLSQLSALFVLTAICFYISILAWSRVSGSGLFNHADVSPMSIAFYELDLMLRGALFDFMQHTSQSISPIATNRNATAFLYYTLIFRMFVATYVMSSLFRVLRFVLRRWKVLLR